MRSLQQWRMQAGYYLQETDAYLRLHPSMRWTLKIGLWSLPFGLGIYGLYKARQRLSRA